MISPHSQHLPQVRAWLIGCMLMVVLMVGIGGITRLTESGLSIVEWKLFSGVFPPLSHQGWKEAFSAYQTSPEFKLKNSDFSLSQFQGIYWLEYIHRLLGRLTGLVFLLPLLVLGLQKKLPRPLLARMLGITLLVAMQGAVGWLMVASGLEHDPRVNPVRLALHLSLAFSIFGCLWWTWLQLQTPRSTGAPPCMRPLARAVFAITILQIIFGALVAGNDAGLSYNTFPLMDGRVVPNGLATLNPFWRNIIENIVMVQWQHRMLAFILFFSCLGMAAYGRHSREPHLRFWLRALLLVITLQFLLGVATLLSVVATALASAHQLLALALVMVVVALLYHTPQSTTRQP